MDMIKAKMFVFAVSTFSVLLILSSVSASTNLENQEEEQFLTPEILEAQSRFNPAPNSTICYDGYGCFSNEFPFDNAGYYLPDPPESLNTQFYLYTRVDQDNFEIISFLNSSSIRNSKYDSNAPIRILVHGFSNDGKAAWLMNLKNEILKKEEANVIIIDWGAGAKFPLYNNATANTRLIGKETCLLMNKIKGIYHQDDENLNIHCIGHSLGAHTCGYASSYCESSFDRITGMDPAGPSFQGRSSVVRLDPADAKLVVAIHTNAGSLLSAAAGILDSVGHMDFFVNGGKKQPACSFWQVTCAHSRSHEYFIETINSGNFVTGYNCPNYESFSNGECTSCRNNQCSEMGYHVNYRARGTMFLLTRQSKPWIGLTHIIELYVTQNSTKSGGILTIFIGDQKFDLDESDFVPGQVTKKVFATSYDFLDHDSVSFKFNRKGSGNDNSFELGKIKITNVAIKEIFTSCDTITITNGKTTEVDIQESDCEYDMAKVVGPHDLE